MRLDDVPGCLSWGAKWRRTPPSRKESGSQSWASRSFGNRRCFGSIVQGLRREGLGWFCRERPWGACSARLSSSPRWWPSFELRVALGRPRESLSYWGSGSRSSWEMDDHRWWDSAGYRWKEACIRWGSGSSAARVWSGSPCRLQRQWNWYMGYPKLNQLLESSTYKSSTIVWDYDIHEWYEKILDILAASIGEISTERI